MIQDLRYCEEEDQSPVLFHSRQSLEMHTAKTSVSIIKARPFTFASRIGERAENLRYMH